MRQIRLLALLAMIAGCSDRPRAPALRNDPVYENTSAGIRFMVPAGWTQQAKSEPSSKPANTEQLLVRYTGPRSPIPATFEVTYQDVDDSDDLQALLAAPSHS